jgi:hypothetical protein
VRDYHLTLRNIAEERIYHQHRGGSLESRIPLFIYTAQIRFKNLKLSQYDKQCFKGKKRTSPANVLPVASTATKSPSQGKNKWNDRNERPDKEVP